MPRGDEELLGRAHHVVRPSPDALRLEQDDAGVGRHQFQRHHHALCEHGGEGLHSLDRDALRKAIAHVSQVGLRHGKLRGPRSHLGRQQQFPDGRRPESRLGDLQGTLVGD